MHSAPTCTAIYTGIPDVESVTPMVKEESKGGQRMRSLTEYLALPMEERFVPLSAAEKKRVEKIISENVLVDLHTHITDWNWEKGWQRDRVRTSRVDCFWEAIAIVREDFDESMRKMGSMFAIIRREPDMDVAYRTEDVRRAKREGKQAVMVQLEPQTVGFDLDLVDVAYGLGVRMMLLTFNVRNHVGDGCGERFDTGLSHFGIDLVEKLNKAGILIDISHCGDNTTLEAIEASTHPIVCSHSGARALNPPIRRLKTDEAIKALARKGGVFAISAIPNQLSSAKHQGIEDMMTHIDYIVKLVGLDHVAIGLDNIFDDHVKLHRSTRQDRFDRPDRIGVTLICDYMDGIESPEEWPNIVRALVKRGYSDKDCAKIVGGNALRVMEAVIG
jgi:membrane dipeptidase